MDGSDPPWDMGGGVSYFSGDWIPSFPQKNTKTDFFGGQWNFWVPPFLQKVPEDVRPKMTIDIPTLGAVFSGHS